MRRIFKPDCSCHRRPLVWALAWLIQVGCAAASEANPAGTQPHQEQQSSGIETHAVEGTGADASESAEIESAGGAEGSTVDDSAATEADEGASENDVGGTDDLSCQASDLNAELDERLPCQKLPACETGQIELRPLVSSDGEQAFPARTRFLLCLESEGLRWAFEALDDPLLHNDRDACNADLWQQEVIEIFIAAGGAHPTRYLELELAPHGQLFVAHIDNPTTQLWEGMEYIACDEAGLDVSVGVDPAEHRWSGELLIPFSLLPGSAGEDVWRANFARVLMHEVSESCTPETCSNGQWSPTYRAGDVIHDSRFFGLLVDDRGLRTR